MCYRGASPTEVDSQGMTPLHYACSAGRPRNVDILLKKSKEGKIWAKTLFLLLRLHRKLKIKSSGPRGREVKDAFLQRSKLLVILTAVGSSLARVT